MPPSKRSSAAAAPARPGAAIGGTPVVNAALVSGAVAYGLWLLVRRGQMTWPPTELLTNAYTLAGSLALIGPVVLARRDRSDPALGELVWMTGGLLVWVFDLAAVARGGVRGLSWATPIGVQTMGLAILAVALAGARLLGVGRSWAWTNVVGWVLGLFWILMGLASLLPGGGFGLALAR